MSFKKYTYRNGKRYGPYLYENKRVGDKIVSTYLGPAPSREYKKYCAYGIVGILIVFLFVFGINFVGEQYKKFFSPPFEHSTINLDSLVIGEPLTGNVEVSLREGECLHGGTEVVASLGEAVERRILSGITFEESVECDFYIEGINIDGSGEGYGIKGEFEEFPVINFEIMFLAEDAGETTDSIPGSGIDEEDSGSENLTPSTGGGTDDIDVVVGEEDVDGEGTEGEVTGTDDSEETEADGLGDNVQNEESSSGDEVVVDGREKGDGTDGRKGVGSDVSEETDTGGIGEGEVVERDSSEEVVEDDVIEEAVEEPVEESEPESEPEPAEEPADEVALSPPISLSVSRDNPVTIPNEVGKLKINRVWLEDGTELDEREIDVEIDGANIIFSTEYSIKELNYGEIYLGDEIYSFSFDLEQFGFIVNEQETIGIEFVYGGESLFGSKEELFKKIEEDSEPIPAEVNETDNETLVTVVNGSRNETIPEVNVTIPFIGNESNATGTIQFDAVINQPVLWKESVHVSGAGILVVELPVSAKKIRVDKEDDGGKKRTVRDDDAGDRDATDDDEREDDSGETETGGIGSGIDDVGSGSGERGRDEESSDGDVEVSNNEDEDIEDEILLAPVVGEVVDVSGGGKVVAGSVPKSAEKEEKQDIPIGVVDGDAVVEVIYETPAAIISSEKLLDNGKQVVVSSEVHYENVLVFTNLDEGLDVREKSRVKVFWVETGKYIVPSDVRDDDGNGVYDYVQWVAPSLSNQTYNIIVIVEAEHLDSNRNFISDIFEEVRELDGVWSETIPDGDYVRVVFEIPLDSTRDITVWPRGVNGCSGSEIMVIDGKDVSCDAYQKKKRIDEIRRLLNG